MASLKYWVWLTSLPKISNCLMLRLLDHFGDPEHIFYGEREEYLLVEGVDPITARILEDKSLRIADRILGDCQHLGLRILTIQDAEYPDRLRNIFDPPVVLYVQGQLPVFDEEVAVAMVGSRGASPYALASGEKLAYELTRCGALVVSGLASGGDAAAHRGALRAGGRTVGVIGGGHDRPYPWENRFLYEDVAYHGAILSEYPPGTRHKGDHFPVRNRIISGLCLATVVLEAPEKSGTLITASRALDQGRDIFALPGHYGDPKCTGSNALIRDGAGIITDVWDILDGYTARYPGKLKAPEEAPLRHPGETLERHGAAKAAPPREKAQASAEKQAPASPEPLEEPQRPRLNLEEAEDLNEDQKAVIRFLGEKGTAQVDEIIEGTELPSFRVLAALTILEVNHLVAQSSGKYFSLLVTLQ